MAFSRYIVRDGKRYGVDDYAAAKPLMALRWEHSVVPCVEINQCVGCTR